MKITVVSKDKPSKENLKALYDLCNKLFREDKYFYTSQEIQELKKDKNNTFIG